HRGRDARRGVRRGADRAPRLGQSDHVLLAGRPPRPRDGRTPDHPGPPRDVHGQLRAARPGSRRPLTARPGSEDTPPAAGPDLGGPTGARLGARTALEALAVAAVAAAAFFAARRGEFVGDGGNYLVLYLAGFREHPLHFLTFEFLGAGERLARLAGLTYYDGVHALNALAMGTALGLAHAGFRRLLD